MKKCQPFWVAPAFYTAQNRPASEFFNFFFSLVFRFFLGSEIKICVKNRNVGQKSKFWSKIESFVKNRKFDQKSKFGSKMEILVKNRMCNFSKFAEQINTDTFLR